MTVRIDTKERDGKRVIAVDGEVDLYTSPELRAAIIKTLRISKGTVVAVDLSEVLYMDSSGVATLVEGLKESKQQGAEFCLVAPSNAVMKVLQLARLDTVFDVRDSV